MKRFIILFFSCVLVLNVQCIIDTNSNKTKNNPDNSGNDIHTYLSPSLTGLVSTWQMKSYDATDSLTNSLTFIKTITGPVVLDGHNYYTIHYSIPGTFTDRFSVELNSIYFQVQEHMFDGRILGTAQSTPLGTDVAFFNFSGTPGVMAHISEGGTMTDDLYVNFDIQSMLQTHETVTTPLGTFDNCPTFQLKFTVTHTPKVTGDTHHYDRIETHWFGKGTGPVKKTAEYYADGTFYARAVYEIASISTSD